MNTEETLDCRECGTVMEDMPAKYLGRIRPSKTYQCPHCNRRLLIYDATPRPLHLSNNHFTGVINMQEFVEKCAKDKGLVLVPQTWPEYKQLP